MRIGMIGALVGAAVFLGWAAGAGAAAGKAAGQGTAAQPAKPATKPAGKPATKPAPAAGNEAAPVVTSTAFSITAKEVEELLSGENAKHQFFTKPLFKVRREQLDGLIDEKLAALDAEKRQVALDAEYQGRVEAALDSWMSSRYLATVIEPASEPTDADLVPYKPERFERIRVRQMSCATEEEARRLREQVLGGGDFAALAAEHSIAPGASERRGELGWLTRGSSPLYPKGLLEPLFALAPGQVSAVFATPLGFEFFRVEERVDLTQAEIDEFLMEPRVRVRREKSDRLVREPCERRGMSVDAAGVDALAAGTAADGTVLGTVGEWKLTAGFLRAFRNSQREDRRMPLHTRAECQRATELMLRQRCLRLELEARGFLDDPANRATIGRFRKKTLGEYALEKLLAPVVPTEEDQRVYWLENRAKLPPVQRVRLKLILVAEKERAEQVHRALVAGRPWDEQASAYSVETNAARGGDLGWLFVHQLNADYQNQALALQPGQFTAPFNQAGRWVILLLAEREEQRAPTEEEARGLLAKAVFEKKRQDFLKEHFVRLRAEYQVKVDEAALERIAPPGVTPKLTAPPPDHPPARPKQ